MAGIDQYTKILLHMNGPLASTAFLDSSLYGHVGTSTGNAQLDTNYQQFGVSSGKFDGTGDWVSFPDSDDWYFDADFTIDFWIRWNGTPGETGICGQSNGGGSLPKWGIYYNVPALGMPSAIGILNYPGGNIIFDTWSPSGDTWYHVAITRSGNDFRLFINGTQQGTTITTSNAFSGGITSDLRVGADGENWRLLNGWIDEFRISKGIARWTTNFTPETSEYLLDVDYDITIIGTASASSSYNPSQGPEYAIDDNLTTQWAANNSGFPYWWKVDFGTPQIITQYTIQSRNDIYWEEIPNNWTLQGSNDNSNWTTVSTHSSVVWTQNEKKTFDITNIEEYRYYRIYITSSQSSTNTSLLEVEMFTTETNLFISGIASADTEFSGTYDASKAFDYNVATRWSTTTAAFPHWLKYDFGVGNSKAINRVSVLPFYDGGFGGSTIENFKIQGSNDDSIWDDLYSGTATNSADTQVFDFYNGTSYRYYRLYITSGYRTDNYSGAIDVAGFSVGGEITVLEDVDTDIRAIHTEVLEDINADIRAAGQGLYDIDTDIRTTFPTYFEDIDTDIRVAITEAQDIDTDIRAVHTEVVENIDTDIRTLGFTLEDINTDIRVHQELVYDIDTDIRVKDFEFKDIDMDIRATGLSLYDIDTDIRAVYVTDDSSVKVESLYIKEGFYLSSFDITIVLKVAGAAQVQFSNDGTSWSTLESVHLEKSWTLSSGDGDKTVYLRFKDIQGNLTDGLTVVEAVVSTTPSTPVTIEAYEDEAATIPIADSSYITTNRALFRWKLPTYPIPYSGFSVATDKAPDDLINLDIGDYIYDDVLVTKATPLPEMTLDISEGVMYSNSHKMDIGDRTLTLSDGGVQDRIDLVCVSRIDAEPFIIEGAESASPEAPAVVSYGIELAEVYVPAGTVNIANVTITDIAPRYVEYNQYLYEDISIGQHTIQVSAQNVNGSSSNPSVFNIWIANTSPEMTDLRAYTDITKTIELANGIYQTASSDVYLEWVAAPNEPGPMVYHYTTDGSDPTIASPSTSNNYLSLGPYGAGIKTIKIVPRDTTTGLFGTINSFIFNYGTISFDDDIAVIGAGVTLRQSLKEIQVQSISWNFDSARTCKIFQPVEFDETLPFDVGDEISVIYGGSNTTVFRGTIKLIERSIETSEEGVLYTCAGPRGELNEAYATIDDPTYGDTANVIFDNVPVTTAISSIISKHSNVIKSVQSYPTGAVITNKFVGQTVSQVLDGIYDSTNYGWYIKPDGTLVSIDRNQINSGQAKFGVYGSLINSLNPQYNVMASNIQFDASARYNKVIIEGAKKLEKVTLSAHCATRTELQELIEEDEIPEDTKYKIYKLNTNLPVKKVLHTSVSYARITGYVLLPIYSGPLIGTGLDIAHKWFIKFVGPVTICRNNKKTIYESKGGTLSYISGQYTAFAPIAPTYDTEIQGSLGPGDTVRFSQAMFNYWPPGTSKTNIPGVTSAATFDISLPDPFMTTVNYDVLGIPKKACATVKAEVLVETVPLRAEVSVSGTASSISKTLRVVKETFKYSEDPNDPIDDTAEMLEYGNDLLQRYKDIKVNGSILLDTIDLSWDLDRTVNLVNTNQGSWTSLNAKVVGITYNFDDNTTTLEITSEFLR